MTELRRRVKDILWRHWFDGPHDAFVAETVVDKLGLAEERRTRLLPNGRSEVRVRWVSEWRVDD